MSDSGDIVSAAAAQDGGRLQAILAAVIDCLPFEFFAIGLDGRYFLQNAVLRAHYGDAIGKRPEDYAPNEDTRRLWLENNRRALAGERVEDEVEVEIQGRRYHYYNLIAPIRDAYGIQGILGVNVDITELKRAQQSLEASQRRYKTLVDTIGLLIYEHTLEGVITFVNAAAESFVGYRPEELVGTTLWDRAESAAERDKLIAYLKYLATEQPPPTPYFGRRRHKDGRWLDIRADWNYIRNEEGQAVGMVTVVTDNTDIKRAEDALKQAHEELEQRVVERTAALRAANEQLRESEERFRRLLEACPDAVVLADLEGHILFASRRTWELLRLPTEQELDGRSVLDFVVPADRARLAANLFDVVQREVRRNTEYTALCGDGGTLPTEASSAVIRDAAGQPKATTAVIRDISQRKEERRRLEHMLRASDHERQLIAYDIHDGLAQQLAGALMQFDVYDRDKTARPAAAANAFRAGMTMLRQGHAEARRLVSGVRPPILDESGVVAAIAHLVNDRSLSAGPTIGFHSNVHFTRLAAILENAIYRIVQEGLTNACKHSRSAAVRISLAQHGDRLRIEIRDWGVGFNPKVFRKNRYGLPGIRERARVLGGRCRIQSKAGKGTSIVVELPLMARAAEE